jgi:serine phosphatase RsbU (regulator of sigma subunit)
VILIAAVWHLAVRRTNWALAIAITAPSIVSLLSNSIGLPPVHLGFLTTTYYDIGLTAGSFAVVALLIEGTWRTWQQGNNLSIEFEAAREIQHQLVTSPPDLPGFHIACVYTPAQQVGGDFFRILPQPGGGVLVVVGDVSGKGLRAAMTVAAIMGALRTISGGRPEDILLAMNRSLAGSMRGGFVTCLCAQITSDGAVTLANAGHLSPYRNGAELEANPGFPLGISAQAEYPETHLHLAPGDTLTFITDGIVEARNAQGELFGFERTCAISTQPAEKIAQTAQAFGQEDDITVLTVTLTPAEVLHA